MTNHRNSVLKKIKEEVSFATLSDVAEIKRGSTITKSQTSAGRIPVLAGGQQPAYYHGESNRDGETIVVAGSGAYAGFVTYWNTPIFVSDAFTVDPHSDVLLTKFCYYFLKNQQAEIHALKSGGGVPHVYGKDVGKLRIPLPSLQVQSEIVSILDAFVELDGALVEELHARRTQYSYYRNQILAFERAKSGEVNWVPLGEVAKNLDSRRKPVTKGYRTSGVYPYYGASGIVDYVGDFLFDGDFLLVSEDGANLLARSTPIAFSISGKNWVNNHAHVLEFDSYEQRRLVEFYLNSIDLSPYVAGGAQPKLSQANMNKILVPVPSRELLAKTVKALDAFDCLLNDNKFGLPAEMSARRMQYEHYRHAFLTFNETVTA
jgi:type I restriction enzyme, S subunit